MLFDKSLVVEILLQIMIACDRVLKRFEGILTAEDFLFDEYGLEKLDSICMQLIVIGESLKKLDKATNQELLAKYPSTEWKKAMGLRDIISHHYFDINAEVIYDVCKNEIPNLRKVICAIIDDVNK